MKRIGLLLAFTAFFATASFAGTLEKTFKGLKTVALTQPMQKSLVKATCKVTETWDDGNGNAGTVTVTVTCTCTAQQACDKAHAAIAIVVP
ncbi:MAG TPA: hypothetical protein VEY10_21400 [Flavisolibacter sp.]|nr:hypothetical protein [Flavisolibacter sp.]